MKKIFYILCLTALLVAGFACAKKEEAPAAAPGASTLSEQPSGEPKMADESTSPSAQQ